MLKERSDTQVTEKAYNINIDKKHEKCLKKLCKKNHKLLMENGELKA